VNYTVGVAAVGLTVADFNSDGVPDIAVLNAGNSTTQPSVSLLLNDGTGFFPTSSEFTITCPSKPCTVQDVASADFDGDGLSDLALSFSTKTTTAGLVEIFTGRGGGQFDLATTASTGFGPRQIAVADFTGDGLLDIAVTEYNSNTVRILRGVGPPTPTPTPTRTATLTPTITLTPTPVPIGGSCAGDNQCASGLHCVDSVCCNSASCPAGQICNYSLFLGECHQKGKVGDICNYNSDCESNYCFAGHCAVAPTSTPTLTPTPLGPGNPCSNSSQCRAGLVCNNNHVCCVSETCPQGWSCDANGCVEPTATPTATATATPAPCDSTNCQEPMRCDIIGHEGTCAEPLALGAPCGKNTDCEPGLVCNPDKGLSCDLPPAGTPTPPPLTTPTACGPGETLVGNSCVTAQVTRSGGCSIGDRRAPGTSAPGTDAWLFTLLPLAFGIRRLRRQGARGQ